MNLTRSAQAPFRRVYCCTVLAESASSASHSGLGSRCFAKTRTRRAASAKAADTLSIWHTRTFTGTSPAPASRTQTRHWRTSATTTAKRSLSVSRTTACTLPRRETKASTSPPCEQSSTRPRWHRRWGGEKCLSSAMPSEWVFRKDPNTRQTRFSSSSKSRLRYEHHHHVERAWCAPSDNSISNSRCANARLADEDMREFLSDEKVSTALDSAGAPHSINERLQLAAGSPGSLIVRRRRSQPRDGCCAKLLDAQPPTRLPRVTRRLFPSGLRRPRRIHRCSRLADRDFE